jgi:hypothetical protein
MQNTAHSEIRTWSVCDVLNNISKQVILKWFKYVAVFLCFCTETTSWRTDGKIECLHLLKEGTHLTTSHQGLYISNRYWNCHALDWKVKDKWKVTWHDHMVLDGKSRGTNPWNPINICTNCTNRFCQVEAQLPYLDWFLTVLRQKYVLIASINVSVIYSNFSYTNFNGNTFCRSRTSLQNQLKISCTSTYFCVYYVPSFRRWRHSILPAVL